MAPNITIQDYTDKSFIVRGNTTEYKDTLKNLGGKWNARLTDKESGDKFGAWLFWTDKREEIEKWLKNGCTNIEINQPLFKNESAPVSIKDLAELHKKIDNLTKLVQSLLVNQNTSTNEEILEDDDDEPTRTPPRRLLSQKKK